LLIIGKTRATRPTAPGRRPRPAADDTGVIAIIVALSISTFLLGFAALAVDLGSAYTRKSELQTISNRLAIAGASGLPDTDAALARMTQALAGICKDDETPGICPDDGSAPSLGWATDPNPNNGQVKFFTDPNGDGKFSLTNQVPIGTANITALQVVLPPSTVEFGLAGAIGVSSTEVHKSSTAKIVTPLGGGILPFALTQADLAIGQFCVADPAAGGGPTLPPPPFGRRPVALSFDAAPPPGSVLTNVAPAGADVDVTLTTTARTLSGVVFYIDSTPATFTPQGPNHYTLTIPPGDPGTTVSVWAEGNTRRPGGGTAPFRSKSGTVTFSGTLPPATDLCGQPSANRGFLQLARSTGGDPLPQNVRTGPQVNLFPDGGLIGSVGQTLNCAANTLLAATTCVSILTTTPFSDDLTAGLLTASGNLPGRLIGNCGNDTTSSHGRDGVDNSDLFTDPGFLDVTHGSSGNLENRLTAQPGFIAAAGPGDQGWITSRALQCPRMAVMPVVDATGDISSFRYVWIDDNDPDRGLGGTGGQVTFIRGYIIDPGYLPGLVSGSSDVGPFLGAGMPKEALLAPNLGGPAS
jgi:Putative Flp pilus-assembly TadE/G-like